MLSISKPISNHIGAKVSGRVWDRVCAASACHAGRLRCVPLAVTLAVTLRVPEPFQNASGVVASWRHYTVTLAACPIVVGMTCR